MKTQRIFLWVLGVCAINIVFLMVRHTTAQEKNQQAYDVACEVTDIPSLKDCVQQARDKKVDLIKISKMIECTSKDDCAVDLSNIETSLKIYGITNGENGFRRTNSFDYSIFTLKNTKNVVIGNFLIEDTVGECVDCPPSITIADSENITVDQLYTKATKGVAVSVTTSSYIGIKNSRFENSQTSALHFSAKGTNAISNNTFIHNHQKAVYGECTGICDAAQVRILQDTETILIDHNTIRDGFIDIYNGFGLYASGIELAATNIKKATISCNKIYNNTGNGLVIPSRTASTSQIILQKNAIYNNGINVNYYTGPQDKIEDNCSVSGCKVVGC